MAQHDLKCRNACRCVGKLLQRNNYNAIVLAAKGRPAIWIFRE